MATKMTTKKVNKELTAGLDTSLLELDAGVGNEEVGQEDLALPFLKLLQASSQKSIKQLKALGINASPGDVWNSVTNELYTDRKLRVIPSAYQRRFIEWTPRGDGTKNARKPPEVLKTTRIIRKAGHTWRTHITIICWC